MWRRRGGHAPEVGDLSRAHRSQAHLLVPVGRSRADGTGRATARSAPGGTSVTTLAPTLQAYITERLIRQRQASPHTVAAYRDAFKLLLVFAQQRTGKPPSKLEFVDLDAPLIGAFLEHLEAQRGNSTRTRNARLAAIHSLFRYAALRHPEDAAVIQRVLAMPPKRFDCSVVTYLTEEEIDALLDATDQGTWTGRRDRAMLTLACQTE